MKHLCWLLILGCVFGFTVVGWGADTPASYRLTLKEAQGTAARKHPRITVAELRALAAWQVVDEIKAGRYPTLTANVTAAGAGDDSARLGAGSLNNPSVFDRNAEGLTVTQLITDFGRISNLAASARLHADAEEQDVVATRAQILLQVATIYFAGLRAQSVLSVAEQTVQTRQLLRDQVAELAKNSLKSDLDVSFASVNLAEARILVAKARNDLQAALTSLAALLDYHDAPPIELVDETQLPGPAGNPSHLVIQALRDRPELARLRSEFDAAARFARAEKALDYPTLSAIGGVGIIPVRDARLPNDYAAAGVNLSLPLFQGKLYSARQKEAALKAQAVERQLHDAENNVIREVRLAQLNLEYTRNQFELTQKLAAHATRALELAQARYHAGASSIVELSQAELNKTSADIAQTSARYESQIQRAALDFAIGSLR